MSALTTDHADTSELSNDVVHTHAAPAQGSSALAEVTLGAVAGLRSALPVAALAWRRWHAGQGSAVTVAITTLAAVGELTVDKMAFAPSRISPAPLIGRAVSGAWSAGTLAHHANRSPARGALYGAAGALAASFGGYHLRRALTRRLASDLTIALAEDAVAVGIAVLALSLRKPSVR